MRVRVFTVLAITERFMVPRIDPIKTSADMAKPSKRPITGNGATPGIVPGTNYEAVQ